MNQQSDEIPSAGERWIGFVDVGQGHFEVFRVSPPAGSESGSAGEVGVVSSLTESVQPNAKAGSADWYRVISNGLTLLRLPG